MISTLNLLGRTASLHIYSPIGLEEQLTPMLAYFIHNMTYKVVFHEFNSETPERIYEDRSLTVDTIPLNHRMPTCGFLFKEKPSQRHIVREMTDFYKVPISWMNRLKSGEDYVTEDGERIANTILTTPPAPPRSYAFCSDTAFMPSIVEQIRGVDLLYHETTFSDEDKACAEQAYHSVSSQAATIAKLAEAKRLVIGHFSSRYDDETLLLEQAKAVFPETIMAEENLAIDITPTSKE